MSFIKQIIENAQNSKAIGQVNLSADQKSEIVAAFQEAAQVEKITSQQKKDVVAAFLGLVAISNLSTVFSKPAKSAIDVKKLF